MDMLGTKIALVGDLVNSRKIEARVAFDRGLLQTMRELSQENPEILSPYTLIGDEIQAVFSEANYLFRDAVSILSVVYPQKMRFSFGLGILIKPINPNHAIEMDGPAFYFARDGIEELKKTKFLFNITGENIPNLQLLRRTLFLISTHMDTWNQTRLKTFAWLQKGLSIKEISEKLSVSQKTIYKTIEDGAVKLVNSLFQEIQANLDETLASQK